MMKKCKRLLYCLLILVGAICVNIPGGKLSRVQAATVDVTSWEQLKTAIEQNGAATLSFKLAKDIAATEATTNTITVAADKDVTIDLNGHIMDRGQRSDSLVRSRAFEVKGKLTIDDSSKGEPGVLRGARNSAIAIGNGGTFTLKGGIIGSDVNTVNSGNYSNISGGAIVINGGTFIMDGGQLYNNSVITSSYSRGVGGAVYMIDGAFIMNNGLIANNTARSGGALYMTGGTFTLNGGEIGWRGNNVTEHGGGVYISGGTFVMNGGHMWSNTKEEVYVSANGLFEMYGGQISNNVYESAVCVLGKFFMKTDSTKTKSIDNNIIGVKVAGKGLFVVSDGKISENNQGGVVVDGTEAVFQLNGGEISDNNCSDEGAGVLVKSGAFVMAGGAVKNNECIDKEGAGVFINSNASFSMLGGSITGNKVADASKGGGVYVSKGATFNAMGDIDISGNVASDSSESNIYLDQTSADKADYSYINVIGELTDNTKLGVTVGVANNRPAPWRVTKGYNDKNSAKLPGTLIFSDVEGYHVKKGDSGDDLNEALILNCSCAVTEEPAKAATCLTDGNIKYYTCAECGGVFSDANGKNHISASSVIIPATGHNWNAPTYTWSADNSSVTAKCVCANDASHVETEVIDTIAETTKEATCSEKGTIKYTATFSKALFAEQSKEVETATIPHSVKMRVTVTKAPTCTEKGSKKMVTYCKNCDAVITETPSDIDALGHDLKQIVYNDKIIEYCTRCNYRKESALTGVCMHTNREKVNEKPATCIEAGIREHYECKDCDAVFLEDSTESIVDTVEDVKAIYIPIDKTNGHKASAKVIENHVAATCDSPETEDEVTYCTLCGIELSRETVQKSPALGHDWDTATYSWSGDNSKVAAKHVCKNDPNHVESEVVDTIEQVLTKSCETDGNTKYTATFTNASFAKQEKTVTIAKSGHAWSEPTYEENGTVSVKAERKCSKCEAVETETANYYSKVTKGKNCTDGEEVTYTAIFVNPAFKPYTKVLTADNAIGHKWKTPEYVWSDDNSSVEAMCVCENDSDHVVYEVAYTTVVPEGKATCADKGITTYTATFKNNLFKTQTKEIKSDYVHAWSAWKVVKNATETEAGLEERVCSVCKLKETRDVAKLDPKPETKEDFDKQITSQDGEKDLANSDFTLLMAKGVPYSKKAIKLTWKKVPNAVEYIIYGNKCGKKNRYKRITSVKSTKLIRKKLKVGTYYKHLIVAVDAEGNVLATSKTIHCVTNGGKNGNNTKVVLSKNKITLSVGKTKKITAKLKAKKAVRIHRDIAWESDDINVATVDKKGKIKAVGAGTCYVYAYAQNGVFAKVKVTVK